MSTVEECVFRSCAPSSIRVVDPLGVVWCKLFVEFGDEALTTYDVGTYVLPCSGLPFHSVGGFLCCAEIFRRREFYLFIFSFASLAHGDISGQYCCEESLKFSCLGFLLGLLWFVVVFKSFLHFQFILVGGVSGWSSCIFCEYLPISPAPFIEETLSVPVYALVPFVRY